MQFSLRGLLLFVAASAIIAAIASSPGAKSAIASVAKRPAFLAAVVTTVLAVTFFVLGSHLVQRESIDHPIAVVVAVACYATLTTISAAFCFSAFYHAGAGFPGR